MRENLSKEDFPVLHELFEKSIGTPRLILRALHAIDLLPPKEYLFEIAYDKDVVAFLYSLSSEELHSIRNLGVKTAGPLYDYMHSKEGEKFFNEHDVGDSQTEKRMKQLKRYLSFRFR